MRRIRHLVRKEFQQLRRDRRMLPIVFIAPVLQLLLLGYAANLDVRDIPTVLCDLDRSLQSRRLASDFFQSGYFSLQSAMDQIERVDPIINHGKAALAIVIPKGFGKSIVSGEQAKLQVIADGSESASAIIGLNYASMIVNRYAAELIVERVQKSGLLSFSLSEISPQARIWYNPELKSRNFMVPGILALLLMVMTMMLTSLAIVKEKELGTLEQLIVTPIKPFQLILGKLFPFVIIGFIDILLVLLVAAFLFGIPVKGSVLLLFALSGVFLLTTLGLGLLVSTVSGNQQQAMMSSVFFVMLPMIFLSGFIFPIENMPGLIQYLTYLIPLRYYFVIIRGLFLKGVGLSELWNEALILFTYGMLILGISVLRFHKRLE